MSQPIEAVFENGVFRPLVAVELPEHCHVLIAPQVVVPSPSGSEATSPATPSLDLPDDGRPIWERIAELSERLPQELLSRLPSDAASQLDHYIYGSPKAAQ